MIHPLKKNWCFWTVVLETTLESPLDSKEIKPVNPEGNQPWIFIGRTDVEAEAPILWPSDAKSQLNGKDPDAGKDWRQEEKGMREDEMAGWHHWLKGHEFEQTLWDNEEEASLACGVHGVAKSPTQLNSNVANRILYMLFSLQNFKHFSWSNLLIKYNKKHDNISEHAKWQKCTFVSPIIKIIVINSSYTKYFTLT